MNLVFIYRATVQRGGGKKKIDFVDLSHLSSTILLMEEWQQQGVGSAGESAHTAGKKNPQGKPQNVAEYEVNSCCRCKRGAKQTAFIQK